MGQRWIGQGNLAEALLAASAGSNRRLERIAGLVDWAPMERLLLPLRAPTGRPGYPPLALFRALLLAPWYQLSDPGLEEALADRLSFRRFCGFCLDDGTPDGDDVGQGPDHAVPVPRCPGRARSRRGAVCRAEPPTRREGPGARVRTHKVL